MCARGYSFFFFAFFFLLFARRLGGVSSEELILAEVHPLDDVAAVVKDTPNVLRVHGAGEMGITIVLSITRCRRDAEELVSNEILGPYHLGNHWLKLETSFFLSRIS